MEGLKKRLSNPTMGSVFPPTTVKALLRSAIARNHGQIKHGDSVAVYGGGIRISDSVRNVSTVVLYIVTVMSICAVPERTILLNVTNMEDRGGDKKLEITPSGGNEVREAKAVKANPTPPADKPMLLDSTIDALTDGNGGHCRNRPGNVAARKECLRSVHGRSVKLGSGSGSGERETCHPEDGGDPAAKKRKTRRGKPKHRKLKPYSKQQMSYGQRLRCRGLGRLTKTGGQPPAPYNTTQFLMEDHSDLPDLEQKLADVITSEVAPSFQKPLAPPRTRDSSFSIDSDEDYFYSSPEDEEEFLTKEFSSAYEDLHAERLSTMTKSELIQEYVQLEAKLDIMTKRLRGKGLQPEERENEAKNGSTATTTTDSEIGKKLKICQQRIDDLIQQNEQLRRDNESLRTKNCASPVSSVDSESDSDSTSNGNRSSCSCSGQSAASPTGKTSFQKRRENEQRRSKRQSSVDSESDSSSTTSSKDSSASPKSHANGNATSHEIGGLPT